ncbi:MAG: FAD-dependent oxidoreductase [Comamonadaceae bacterium]|nr:FAD-dependent oxidoreductase [Comamonadaceae bacterium]
MARLGRDAIVFEADDLVGGISRSVVFRGCRLDIGGHRFFTKVPEVERLWREILGDDLLVRRRMSRIYYRGRFFDYPLRPVNALRGLGVVEAARVLASYARARLFPVADERTFDAWVSNRFGRRLFEIFFKTYTEKVWGMPCSEISAAWAAQRIKNLDLDDRDQECVARQSRRRRRGGHQSHRSLPLSASRTRHDVGAVPGHGGGRRRAHPPVMRASSGSCTMAAGCTRSTSSARTATRGVSPATR